MKIVKKKSQKSSNRNTEKALQQLFKTPGNDLWYFFQKSKQIHGYVILFHFQELKYRLSGTNNAIIVTRVFFKGKVNI